MTRSVVFARLATRPIPRVTRMMTVALSRGYEPLFVGALRDANAPSSDTWDGFPIVRVGRHFPLVNGTQLLVYCRGVARFNLELYSELRRRVPAIVHASDFEAGLACALYAKRHGVPLIYNIHDNLADRYNLPAALRYVLRVLEGLLVLLAREALVPEGFRRDALPRWVRARVRVVRNAPVDRGWSEPEVEAERVRVLYAGWLDEGRALQALLELARRHLWMDVRIAGEGSAEMIERVTASGATYLGFLGHVEVMAETQRCHFVAAFYDPVRPINRTAAPNKLAEALSAARPVLINDEVLVAHAPALVGCLVRVPYRDVLSVAAQVKDLYYTGGGLAYVTMCHEARKAYESDYSWETIRQEIDDLYARIEG